MPFPTQALTSLNLEPSLQGLAAHAAGVLERWGWTDSLSSDLVHDDGNWVLEIAGVWRLSVGITGGHVDRRRWMAKGWDRVRIASLSLSKEDDEEGAHAMPFLQMWPRRNPADWLEALWPQALDEALLEARMTHEEQTGHRLADTLVADAKAVLQELWFGPRGLVKKARLVEQARELRYRVERLFDEPKFNAYVRAVRRGFPVGLGHLLQAWDRRTALRAIATKNRAWLPLLNVIALRHWNSTGWQEPVGWTRRQAVVWDRHGEPRLPWAEGLAWHETDLPVFANLARAKVWLGRGAGEACVGVWGTGEDVQAFENDLARWKKQDAWPRRALPSPMLGELQRLHKNMSESLIVPTCEALLDEAVHYWIEQSMNAWSVAGADAWERVRPRLATEWDQLIGELRQLPRDFEGRLADLASVHPWSVQLRSAYMDQHLPAATSQAPVRERF